jgi:hypothetical protein
MCTLYTYKLMYNYAYIFSYSVSSRIRTLICVDTLDVQLIEHHIILISLVSTTLLNTDTVDTFRLRVCA